MPIFNLKCIERFIEITYYTIEADSLSQAVKMAASGEAGYHDSEDGDHEAWLDLQDADLDGKAISKDELQAAKAPHRTSDLPALTARERATVLAALRSYQSVHCNPAVYDEFTADIHDIATDGGTVEPLTAEQLDALCNRLDPPVTNEQIGEAFEQAAMADLGVTFADLLGDEEEDDDDGTVVVFNGRGERTFDHLEFPCEKCGKVETLGTGSAICEECEAKTE